MQNVNYLCALTHTYTRNSNKMYFLENCYNKISINNSKKKKKRKNPIILYVKIIFSFLFTTKMLAVT